MASGSTVTKVLLFVLGFGLALVAAELPVAHPAKCEVTSPGNGSENAEAEAQCRRILDECDGGAVAQDCASLPAILNNLGGMYYAEGRFREAEPLLRRAVALSSSGKYPNLGFATALNNLAVVYKQERRLDEAADLYRRALAGYIANGDKQNAAIAMNNFGRILDSQGQGRQAEQMFRDAIRQSEQAVGLEHPDVAVGLSNLARLLSKSHKYIEAKRLLDRAIQIDRANFAARHPRLGYDLHTAAILALDRRDYPAAEDLFRQVLQIFEQSLPPNHPEIGKVTADLAEICVRQRRWEEAEAYYRRAVPMLEQNLVADNPQLLPVLESYSRVLRVRQEYAEAASVDAQTMKIRVRQALRIAK